MNALTVCQPYAHLIAVGVKPIENRTWPTSYRGELAIHAGLSREWLDAGDELPPRSEWGVAGGVRAPEAPQATSEHANGPWCFVLERVRRLRVPVPCRGYQQIWIVPDVVEARLRQELAV